MPVMLSEQSSSQITEIQFGRTLFLEFTPTRDERMSRAQSDAIQNAILEFKKRDKQIFSHID